MEDLFEVIPWSRCISVQTSADRRQDTRKEFAKKGLKNPTFLVVQRDNENPGRGCYMSHLACMKKALRENQPCALVMEDDAVFEKVPRAAWQEAAHFIATQPFDILLLGWCKGSGYRKGMCLKSTKVTGYSYIYKTKCLCTHAVVYSKAFMDYFVTNHSEYPGYEIDDVFAELPAVDVYIVSPMLFGQRDVPSVIDDPNVERAFEKPISSG